MQLQPEPAGQARHQVGQQDQAMLSGHGHGPRRTSNDPETASWKHRPTPRHSDQHGRAGGRPQLLARRRPRSGGWPRSSASAGGPPARSRDGLGVLVRSWPTWARRAAFSARNRSSSARSPSVRVGFWDIGGTVLVCASRLPGVPGNLPDGPRSASPQAGISSEAVTSSSARKPIERPGSSQAGDVSSPRHRPGCRWSPTRAGADEESAPCPRDLLVEDPQSVNHLRQFHR